MPHLQTRSKPPRLTLRHRLSLARDWINMHAWLLAVPVVLLCGWALYAGWHAAQPPNPVHFTLKLYFIDEETNEVYIKSEEDIPPLLGKSGKPTIVQAIYMTNSDCQNKTLVYLLKYSDAGKTAMDEEIRQKGHFDPMITMAHNHDILVRKPDPGSPWVRADQPEANAILYSFESPNSPPKPCNPN